MNKFGRAAAKTGIALAATAASLLVVETGLRLGGYEYTPLRVETVKKWSEWRYYHAFEDKHFVYDPVLIWRPRKGGEFFNEQGYRGKVISPMKDFGTTRIFAIGDSNTLGWPGNDAPNWPLYLEQVLNQNGHPSVVVNAGVYGYTSFQGVRRFNEALAFHPDLVLISFGCNDAMRVTISDADFANRRVRQKNWDLVLMRARVGQLLLAIADSLPWGEKEHLVPRVSLEEYKANLEEIIRISRDRHIRTVLLTRPFTGPSPTPWWWKNFAHEYNDATIATGAQTDVPVVDIYTYFKDCTDCFVDEAHFTEIGLRQMATLIYEAIRRDLPAMNTIAQEVAR